MKRYHLIASCALTMMIFTDGQAGEAPDLSGAQLFQQFCASCHGREAHGDGPAAQAMKVKVPDLTRISARNSGKFPASLVQATIDGRKLKPSHGSADMPVWGWEFYGFAGDDGARRKRVDDTIAALVDFLRTIQQ